MNTIQFQFGKLPTNRSFQVSLIVGLVILALLAAYVSVLSAGSAGELAGRKTPPMPAAQLQDADNHLAGGRRPMPQLGMPEQGNFMAGRRPPASPIV
jgi:hypothetical protein